MKVLYYFGVLLLSAVLLSSCISQPNSRLHDIWVLRLLGSSPASKPNGIPPTLEINLTRGDVLGYDGCNEYTGSILTATGNKLRFGGIATIPIPCGNGDLPKRFIKTLAATRSYELEGLVLRFFDGRGVEVMALGKVD